MLQSGLVEWSLLLIKPEKSSDFVVAVNEGVKSKGLNPLKSGVYRDDKEKLFAGDFVVVSRGVDTLYGVISAIQLLRSPNLTNSFFWLSNIVICLSRL